MEKLVQDLKGLRIKITLLIFTKQQLKLERSELK